MADNHLLHARAPSLCETSGDDTTTLLDPQTSPISHVESNGYTTPPKEAVSSWDFTQEISSEHLTGPAKPSAPRPWRTGFLHNFPWLGFSAVLIALCSTAASAVVLVASNQAPVTSWQLVSPTVILAILSPLSLACLKIALSKGVTIAWWRRLLHPVPLADTHRTWDYGTSLWASVTAGKHFNLISLATILVAVAAIESPLIQRASTVSAKQISKPINMTANLAANLPVGYTANAPGENLLPQTPSIVFSDVYRDYINHAALSGTFEGCLGDCEAKVPGVGLMVDCQSHNTSFDMKDYEGGVEKPQFSTNTGWSISDGNGTAGYTGGEEALVLNAGWAINTNAMGNNTFINRVCHLSLAIVSYPLHFANGTTNLNLTTGTNPDVISKLPVPRTISYDDKRSTLGGFYLLGNLYGRGSNIDGPFYANVNLLGDGAQAPYDLDGLNPFSWSQAVNSTWNVNDPGSYVWTDPVPSILAAYHEIMFRLALKAAANASTVPPFVLGGINYTSTKKVTASANYTENYYVSHYRYLAGAMAAIVVGILSVLPSFQGWWKLGRSTTLSPLETAKAFGAPLLADYNSNGTVSDFIPSAEHIKVQYGAVRTEDAWDSKVTLQLAESDLIDIVRDGTIFTI